MVAHILGQNVGLVHILRGGRSLVKVFLDQLIISVRAFF